MEQQRVRIVDIAEERQYVPSMADILLAQMTTTMGARGAAIATVFCAAAENKNCNDHRYHRYMGLWGPIGADSGICFGAAYPGGVLFAFSGGSGPCGDLAGGFSEKDLDAEFAVMLLLPCSACK